MRLRARHVEYLWDALNGLLLAAVIAILLSGCATIETDGDYWHKVRDPVPVRGIVYVAVPCGRKDWDGCAVHDAGLIFIKHGLRPVLRACVESHERKHLAGYDHEDRGTGYATDCGDGTMVPG